MKLTIEQSYLVSENTKLVYSVINKKLPIRLFNGDMEYEELVQVGNIALCKAAIKYDGSTKFSTFAFTVIKNALYDYARKYAAKKDVTIVSLDEVNSMGTTLLETLVAEDDSQSAKEVLMVLNSVKSRYSGVTLKGIEVIELKIQGYAGKDIAEMYGVSQSNVGAWISRAVSQLKNDRRFMTAFE